MRRGVGPDPDEPSRPPDPDRQFEKRRMERAVEARSNDGWSCGWSLGPRVRAATTGVLPRVATRDRIEHYQARHYGWKGHAVNAWNKLANHDKFATTPSRMDFVTDFPGAAGKAVYFGSIWGSLRVLFITRHSVGRAWCTVTRVLDGAERLFCGTVDAARTCGGVCSRVWNATLGRVVSDD